MADSRTAADGGMETSYGFRDVASGEKQGLVNDVFHKVAKRYDVMNDVMSMGLHRAWKDAMIASLHPRKDPDYKVLDVAGGTGDIAFRIVEASGGLAHATVLDINGSMLAVGTERAEKKKISENLTFVEANAEDLPFEAGSFDAYTIAFGIRNVPRIDVALKEAHRVLKRGGRL
ncbi:MAG: ubiquinone/menaquinone biosynthesis methyltransferase, partial [Rhizobium sp.]